MTRVICNHQKFSIAVEQIKAWLFSLLSYLCFKTKKKTQQKNSSVFLKMKEGERFLSVSSLTQWVKYPEKCGKSNF